jgi:glutamate-1-semialdehyde 2,1-aminomutase
MKRGLLMPSSIVSYAHSDKDIEQTVDKIQEVLVIYKKALDEGIEKYLVGEPVKPVYRKYND